MRTKPALLTLTIAALALTACAGPTITPATPAAHKPAAAVAAQTSGAAKLGDTTTFSDGIKATVTAHTIKAGQYAYGAVDGRILVVTVKLTNTSHTAINAVMTSVPTVTVGANGTPAGTASDPAVKVGTIGDLLPGETQTAETGYGVAPADLGSVRVSVADPDLAGDPAVFKGAVR